MLPKTLYTRLTKPGDLSEYTVFMFGILAILAITIVDISNGEEARLHTLHLFPLAAIALHCKQKKLVFGTAILSLIAQITTLNTYSLSRTIHLLDFSVAIASTVLTVILAMTARQNYLDLADQAQHDLLTGLLNRRRFLEILNLEIALKKRHGGSFSLAMIDLDNFKQLNDLRGHKAGDDALQLFAVILRKCTRSSDALARLGGDEFIVLLRGTAEVDAKIVSQKICGEVKQQMSNAGFSITASIGCKTFNDTPTDSAAAISLADELMYEAKKNGKGRMYSQ